MWYVCVCVSEQRARRGAEERANSLGCGGMECAHTHIARSDYLEELGSGWGFDLYMLFAETRRQKR